MVRFQVILLASILALANAPSALHADPNKDESGKGDKYKEAEKDAKDRDDLAGRDWDSYDQWVRDRSRRDRSSPYFRDRYSRLDIPYGHYPPPGECRLWYPDLPPGQQPAPGDCRSLRSVPRDAWSDSPPARCC